VPRTLPAPAAAGHVAPKRSLPRPVIITGAGAITAVAVAAIVVALSISDRPAERVTEPPAAIATGTPEAQASSPAPAPSASATAKPTRSAGPTARATSAAPSPSGAPTPSPTPALTVDQAINRFQQLVDAGLSSGSIHDPGSTQVGEAANDVARDLKQIAGNLRQTNSDPMADRVTTLRNAVAARAGTGAIDTGFVPALNSAIDDIVKAAGSGPA